jgi:hypothetical protein
LESYSIADEDWQLVMQLLPPEWERQAASCGALSRLRGFHTEEALLRTLLLHVAKGYSLRETVVRAKAAGLAEVSDVALLKRLRNSEQWLREMCQALLQENGVRLPEDKGMNVRVFDATTVKEPGKTGSLWRIHYSLRLPSLNCDFFELTPTEGAGNGESLTQFPVAARDFVIADRGYATANGIDHLDRSGAYALVRVNTSSLPIYWQKGQKVTEFPLLKKVSTLTRTGAIGEWEALVSGPHGQIRGRVCAIRKSEQAIRQTMRKLKRMASKRQVQQKPETLEYGKYVILFTTLPATRFTAAEALEWYRARWQIELVFKRFKSLAQLGHLPKYDEQSSRAWLYGKLFTALLTQKLIRVGRDFSPWGYLVEQAVAE